MASPKNIRAGLLRAARADNQLLKDPGDGGTIVVTDNPGDRCVCIVEGGTTRVLSSATYLPVGTEVTVISQTSSITVSTVATGNVALADGEFLVARVGLNSSGTKVWQELSSSDAAGILPASAGTYEFLNTETAADAVAGILAIVSALDSAGLIDGSGITQATS